MDRQASSFRVQEAPSVKDWSAVAAVSVGIFAVITAEQLPIGLLTQISSAMNISTGTTGLLVTIPGIIAGVSAPLLPLAVGQWDRRKVLVSLMANMAVANMVSSVAPNYLILLMSRVFVGISIGGFFALVGNLAMRLVPKEYVPRATSIIFGGVAAATVLGVPFGTFIGELSNWRMAFAILGFLGIIVLAALLILLPNLPTTEPVKLQELKTQSQDTGVQYGLLITFLLVTGHFAAYTFVSPALQTIANIDESLISSLLLVFGATGIIGNFIAGTAAGRTPSRTIFAISATLVTTLLLFATVGTSKISGIILLSIWGLAFGGVSVSLQTWIQKSAPQAVEPASALWTSIFNLSISFGALMGGLLIESVGIVNLLLVSAALILPSVVISTIAPDQ